MKIELKHLTPYLPYGLVWSVSEVDDNRPYNREMTLLNIRELIGYTQRKPILRPLSDLTETIEHGNERFTPSFRIDENCSKGDEPNYQSLIDDPRWCHSLPNYIHVYLLQWHFDVFGLIDKGLAIPKT